MKETTVKLVKKKKTNPHCKRNVGINNVYKNKSFFLGWVYAHFHPVERHARVISRDSGESVSFHQVNGVLRHAQSHSD